MATDQTPAPRYRVSTFRGRACVIDEGRGVINVVICECGITEDAHTIADALNAQEPADG